MTKLTRRPGPIWLLVLTTAVLATVLYHYHTPVNHLILRMTQSARLLTQSKARKSATDLGPFFSWGEKNWTRLNCDPHVPLRHVSLLTGLGNLTFYVYDSAKDDFTVTQRALKGVIFEREEIEQFLNLSKPLPLIDVGANLGLVALQAAMQGRQVVAVEPILDNALRLCRSAADFLPDPSLMRVVRNAVSSAEGNISLFSPGGHGATLFQVGLPKGRAGNVVHAIRLERLVEVVSFKTAVLKVSNNNNNNNDFISKALFHVKHAQLRCTVPMNNTHTHTHTRMRAHVKKSDERTIAYKSLKNNTIC